MQGAKRRALPMNHETSKAYGQGFKVLLVIVFAAAITGYFSGMRHAPPHDVSAREPQAKQYVSPPEQTEEASTSDAPRAVSYEELGETNLGPNRDFRPSLEGLPPPEKITSRKKFPKYTEEEKRQALDERAERRAFDGAPPVVPHKITQIDSVSCLKCHGEGTKIGDRHASKICHDRMSNCTQCHVEGSANGGPPRETLPNLMGENEFVGLEAPLHGERATRTAPPMIPHTTWMRTDCLSCHGPSGKNAIQTRHPYRQNCNQCHAPSAALDQQPVAP